MSDYNSYPPRPHKGDRLYWPLSASPVRAIDYDWRPSGMPACPHGRYSAVLTAGGRWECPEGCQENLASSS